ncbi:MAG: hypothetical protein AAB568_03930 [Patescibacteria group bacterium]
MFEVNHYPGGIMPKLHSMRDGFPQITEYNGVPILFTLWRKGGKPNVSAMVDLTDPKNPKWVKLPSHPGDPREEIPVGEVVCWSEPPRW